LLLKSDEAFLRLLPRPLHLHLKLLLAFKLGRRILYRL
jgi:hypothetical protein